MPASWRTEHLKALHYVILISSALSQNYHWILRGLVTAVFGFTQGCFVKSLSFLGMADAADFGLHRGAIKSHLALASHSELLALPMVV
jgi:hypothetical protein